MFCFFFVCLVVCGVYGSLYRLMGWVVAYTGRPMPVQAYGLGGGLCSLTYACTKDGSFG